MAQLVVAAAGAAIGFVVGGPAGARIGFVAGSLIGSTFAPTQKSAGPRLDDLKVSTSSYGTPIPYIAGHPRVSGQIVWASTKREIATTEEAGKGGGGSEFTTFTYEVDLLYVLSDNQIGGVSRIWNNGELVYNVLNTTDDATREASAALTLWTRITSYSGAADQMPDPTYEAAVGTANALAYRGRGSVFIESLQLGGSGQIPNLTFEVWTLGTTFEHDPLVRLATMFPGNTTDLSQYAVGDGAYSGTIGSWTQNANSISYTQIDTGYSIWRYDNIGFRRGSAEAVTVELLFGATLNAERNTGFSTLASCNIDGGLECRLLASGKIGGVNLLNMDTNPGPNLSDNGPDYFNGLVHHAAWVFTTDDKLYYFIDGVRVGGPFIVPLGGIVNYLNLGGYYQGVFANTHIIYGARITKDALYSTATYTPPTDFTADYGSTAVTLIEATVQDTATALCESAGLQAGQFDATALSTITRPVRAMAISQVSSARIVLEMLASSYHFDAVLSDKLYFRPRASASVATLTFDEFGVAVDSNNTADPLPLMMANELEIPAQMAITFSNVDGDYQTDTQYSDRLLTGQESTSATALPLGFTASEGKQIADALLLDKAVSALTTSVSLNITRTKLEPTDVVVLTGDDGSTYRMRVVKKTEASGVITLGCAADDASVFTQAGVTTGGTASQTTVAAPATATLVLLDIPLLRDADNTPGHYAAVSVSSGLYESSDDITYTLNKSIPGGAVMGTCTTTLGAWTGGNFADEKNTLTVSVGDGQLSSVTHEQMLASSATNAAVVGSELIQFREAALVSAGVYTLSGLLRGKRGTELAADTHGASERFVLLSSDYIRFITQQASDIGQLTYYKAATSGQSLSAVTAQSLTLQSLNLRPLTPTNQRISSETGDAVITWDRRTRVAENWLTGAVPLGETVEAWEIDVLDGATVKRTLTSSSATVTYTNAQRYADFGGAAASVDFAVYQMSSYVGRGDGASASASLSETTPSADLTSLILTDTVYPVCSVGSTFIATQMTLTGPVAVHRVLESTNGGQTLNAVSGSSVFLSKEYTVGRSDGVYVSLPWMQVPNSTFKEFEVFSRDDEISIMRGVAGSLPRYAVTALPLGNDPIAIGCNGTNFYILMEGNHIWKSTDGDTFTDTGAASGFPYTFASAYSGNNPNRNYTNTSNLHWTGAAWLFAFSGKLYRSTDSDALTGWTEITWAGLYYYGPDKFVQTGSVILAALYASNNPSNMRFERSTDDGATWTSVWNREDISPATLPTSLTLAPPIAIDGEFVASTSNGEYRRISSTASGVTWAVGSNDPSAGWSAYVDQVSDGTNVLGYSRVGGYEFIYSADGMTYAATTIS